MVGPRTRPRSPAALLAALALAGAVLWPSRTHAQAGDAGEAPPAVAEGVVVAVASEETVDVQGEPQVYQRLEVRLEGGPSDGAVVVADAGGGGGTGAARFAPGDRVLVEASPDGAGGETYFVADRVRRAPLYALFGLFVAAAVVVGRWRGFASLIGMALSFAVIFAFVLPRIAAGWNPIGVAIAAALVVIPVTFGLSHGVNRKTAAAVAGTVIALAFTGVLASVFVGAARLTGYASEEASFLQIAHHGALNVQGLLLASIIIGLLGILDDITVSQAAIVYQLHAASPGLPPRSIFTRAMDVGRDHIASLVNTLVLVYTSAALPLLLLFRRDTASFATVVNYEIVAEEIVRTLVASIGLILAVPITTAITCALIARAPATPPAGASRPPDTPAAGDQDALS